MDGPKYISPQESTGDMMEAIIANYPQLVETIVGQSGTVADARAASDLANAPKYAEMQAQLFEQLAPIFAEVGRNIYTDDQLNAAKTEKAIADKYGAGLVSQADKFQRMLDPEFYSARGKLGQGVEDLISSMDPTALSGSERAEIERAIGRGGFKNQDSAMDTVANAMTFGSALQDKQARFGNALMQGAQVMPAIRSGLTGFEIATRRPLMTNQGTGQFIGAQQGLGDQTFNLGQGFMNQVGGLTNSWVNNQANRKDFFDRLEQVGSFIGDTMPKTSLFGS